MIRMKAIEPTLKTVDLDKTIGFYRDLLGFRLDTLWPEDNPTFCILSQDKTRLMFFTDSSQPNHEPIMTGQLRLDMDGVMALYSEIQDRVETEWGPEVFHYDRREVSIRDCNGYSIIFSETTSDPPTCHDE